MKKFLMAISKVGLAIGILAMFGCSKGFTVKDSLTAVEAGDPIDRTVNLDSISESDGLIYYTVDEKLYQRKYDWTERLLISDNPVASFQIVGEWIYYLDSADGGSLYKMRNDGSEDSLISDDSIGVFAVSGDTIFYSTMLSLDELNATKKELNEGKSSDKITEKMVTIDDLYRIGTDGTGKVKLVSDGTAPQVFGDWVYYHNAAGNLFHMKADGTEQSKIAEQALVLHESGDYLYYTYSEPINDKGEEKIFLYRMKLDGSEASEVWAMDRVVYYTFDDGYFYYGLGKDKGGLYRMNLDGTNSKKMNEVGIYSLDGVAGDWMYTTEYEGPTFRVKLDGTIGVKLD
jgi:hypothetical protein